MPDFCERLEFALEPAVGVLEDAVKVGSHELVPALHFFRNLGYFSSALSMAASI